LLLLALLVKIIFDSLPLIMKAVLPTAFSLVSASNAINLGKPRDTPQVLSYDLERRTAPVEQLVKRATNLEVPLANLLV
jgi:hypothetical protein